MGPEAKIEKSVSDYATSLGVLCRKLISPGHRFVPDRIFFYRGHVWLIEFKAPGKIVRPGSGQDREIERLRVQGIGVFVCNDIESGKVLVRAEMRRADAV